MIADYGKLKKTTEVPGHENKCFADFTYFPVIIICSGG
jgi:hypothetical protein